MITIEALRVPNIKHNLFSESKMTTMVIIEEKTSIV